MKKKILGIGAAVLILSAAVFAGCGLTGTRIRSVRQDLAERITFLQIHLQGLSQPKKKNARLR